MTRLRTITRTVVRVLALAAVLWLIAEVLAAIDPRVPAVAVLAGLLALAYLRGRADGEAHRG